MQCAYVPAHVCMCTCAYVNVVYVVGVWYSMRYSILRAVNINVLLNSAVCHVLVCLCLVFSLCLYVIYHLSVLLSPGRKVSTLKNEEFFITNVCSVIWSYDMCVYCDCVN